MIRIVYVDARYGQVIDEFGCSCPQHSLSQVIAIHNAGRHAKNVGIMGNLENSLPSHNQGGHHG